MTKFTRPLTGLLLCTTALLAPGLILYGAYVLIVLLAMHVGAALQHYGVQVIAVSSSHAALEALDASIASSAPPDVIVTDIGLPDEDGYRLMEQLGSRGKSLGGRIPVIALTAYGRPQDKRRALAAGFRMHLTKPVTPEALASALAVLAQKR